MDKWQACTSDYTSDTSTAKKCFDLVLIIAFGASEGFHRAGSYIQALIRSRLDSTTGVISGPCELTYQQFVDSGVTKLESVEREARSQDVVENVLSEKCVYFDETSNLEVKWISAKIEATPTHLILQAFRRISEQTSDNKYKSVQNPAWVTIGSMGCKALYGIPRNNCINCPDNSRVNKFFRMTVVGSKPARVSLDKANDTISNTVYKEDMNAE